MKDIYQSKPNKNGLLLPNIVGLHYRVSTERLFTIKEIDDFVQLYENAAVSEADIHSYLKQNPKFLYALGAYETYLSEVSLEDKNTYQSSMGKLRIDFFLKNMRGFWDFVELKKPYTSNRALIVGNLARRRFSTPVQDALAQTQTYLNKLADPEIRKELQKIGIELVRPQAWIIIGRSVNMPLHERKILEAELPRPCKLVTYDDLTELAKQRLLVVTSSFIVPSLPINMTEAAELYKFLSPNWSRNVRIATELLDSFSGDEPSLNRLLRLFTEPVNFIAENWDKGVQYFTTDDGDDRGIAQWDYEILESYTRELENCWECRGLNKFLGKRGHQSWQFNIDFKQLTHQIAEQITAFLLSKVQ
jgi:hypothetical protein